MKNCLPKQVFTYVPYEMTFTSEKIYKTSETPWLSVKFNCTFIHSSGKKIIITGFWDGDNVFKIRFTPTLTGVWSYATSCNSDKDLNNLKGELNASPYIGDNPVYENGGFLRASDNGRYLTYTNGKPFFYLSDTWWFGLANENMPIEKILKPCLKKRKEQSFSVILTGLIGSSTASKEEMHSAYHTKKDILPRFWQGVDEAIKAITGAGMLVVISPLWVLSEKHCNREEWLELVDYMNARYSAYPIIFGSSGEYNSPERRASGFEALALELLEHFNKIDPYKRALTIQPHPWNLGADKLDWDQSYIGFLMLEGGHEEPFGIPTEYYREAWNKTIDNKHRPLVLVETVWEGISRHGYVHDDYTMRFNLYRAFLSGCMGMGYGTHGLWYPTQNELDTTFELDWGKSIPWYEAVQRPGAQNAAYLRKFFTSMEWWTEEPLYGAGTCNTVIMPPNILDVKPDKDYYRVVAAKFKNGKNIVIYIPATYNNAEPITMQSGNLNIGSFEYYWFDPRKGENRKGGMADITEDIFTLPQKPDCKDWVLVIKNELL